MATQMQLKVLFGKNRMTARTFRKEKQQQKVVLFFMFTLMWITEKELERVIENKRDKFCRKENMKIQSGCENEKC